MTAPPPSLAEAMSTSYRLERELGRGGMATVWLARDLRHDRPVALKLLRPELSAILGGERFLREIKLTAQLQHPHILTLIDSGSVPTRAGAGELLYYVMPFVEGETLRQRLAREGTLSLPDVRRLTEAVAAALDYAHGLGIIHRDIKPENILLHRGEPMVADFGIALAASQAGRERLTETGLSLGTPAYMSPEQASAEPRLDGRSDQYSLACVVYEMLAGEPPYTGPTAHAIIAKRLSDPVPHLSTVREVPVAVDAAVRRALARSPADRFGSASEFAAALGQSPAPPARYRRRWAAALLASLAALGAAALLSHRAPPRGPATATHRQVTFTGTAGAPALSPDGHWLAYVGDGSLLVHDLLAPATPVSVVTGPRIHGIRWSKDGARLYYMGSDSSGWAIYAVPRQGGVSRRVAWGAGFDLAPAGDRIYFTIETDSVFAMEPESGKAKVGFSLLPLATTVHALALSPDGRWLAFTGVNGSVTFLGLCRTDGSHARRLADGVPRDGSLGWTAAGDAIYYLRDLGNGANVSAAGDIMKLHVAPNTGEPRGEPTVVLGGAFVQAFHLSPDGRRVAYTKAPPQQKIWAMTLDGPAAHPAVSARELSSGTSIHGTPDISPDGKWVTFARNDGGNGNLYVTPFDRYEPRPLVVSPADEWSPRWSPDGARIAYAVRDPAAPGILVADVATGQSRRITGDGLAPLGVIAWMPNAREIVFPLDLGRHYAIEDVATGRADTLAASGAFAGFHLTVPSPDGRHIAVNTWSRQMGPAGLWSLDRSGRPWKHYETGHGTYAFPLLWSVDGWIYFLSSPGVNPAEAHGGGGTPIMRVRADGGTPAPVVLLPQPCSFWETALSADARRLVCTVSRTEPDVWLAENFDPEDRQ